MGESMVTMRDVAQASGVSTATVSRVLNGGHLISTETVGRVQRVMEELGYCPNRVARSLRKTTTSTIGVLVSNVGNLFFADLVRAIEDEAFARDLGMVLANADETPERQRRYLDSFLEQQVDGLIITPTGSDTAWVAEFERRGTPVVLVDRTLPGVDLPTVTTDHDDAVDQLVAHVVALGHRTAALLTGVPANSPTRRRVEAFLAAAQRHGLGIGADDVLHGGVRRELGVSVVMERFARPARPDVLFATNNVMSMASLEALRRLGLRVPDDVAFAGYDDHPWFEAVNPPVTAIAQPVSEMGAAAVRLVTDQLAGEPPRSVALPARFLPRLSCGEP